MDVIKLLQTNEQEHKKLELAAAMMTFMDPDQKRYLVSDTYFDFGIGLRWTTILGMTDIGSSGFYQALTPKTQELILASNGAGEMEKVIEDYFDNKK